MASCSMLSIRSFKNGSKIVMKRLLLVSAGIVSGMLTAATQPDATAEITTIKALPLVGGEHEWKLKIDQLTAQFPQEEVHFANVAKLVNGIARLTEIYFPQGVVGDAARAISHTTAKITLGVLREDTEKSLNELKSRAMDRSYSAKNQRLFMVRALYEQLLAKITALQEQIK